MEALYQPGDLIRDKYRIVGILGEGGTAITYKAIDTTQSDSSVAIKVLSLQQTRDWKLVELFEREAKVLSNLHHPRIPKYLDYFAIDTDRDRQFLLVQELIPGKSLGDLVAQGWYFQESEVKDIAKQVLEILTYLHGFQPPVIHRDVKPHNIIRTEAGEIYLVDLGAVQDVYRNTLTRGATFVGTIDYMSPEQLRGHASFASDLYSLGCTLLYLLTRRSPSELPLKRMKIDFRSSLKISEQFADWLETLLEPVLEDRFSSTEEALKQLTSKQSLVTKSLTGSLIQITRKTNVLLVHIPTNRNSAIVKLKYSWILPFVVFGFCTVLYSLSKLSLLPVNFVIVRFFLLLEGCLFIPGIINVIFLFFGHIDLKIEKEEFSIIWNCLGIKKQRKGRTEGIQAICLKKTGEYKNDLSKYQNKELCIFYEGVKEHRFGMWLTTAERRWLITEIADFVIEQYPNKNKEDWLRDIWKLN